jgi:peptidyl-prolyl cis-trans isomerase C
MYNSKFMAFFAAGAIACGGFTAFAADEAAKKVDASEKPAEVAKPAEDPFSAIPAFVAEINGEKITKDMVVAQILGNLPEGKLTPGVTAEQIKQILPNIVKSMVLQKIFELELAKAGIKPSAEATKAKLEAELKKMDKAQIDAITMSAKTQGKTLDQYIDELANNPMFQQQMAGQTYLEEKVLKDLKFDKTIAPGAAEKYYAENKDQYFTEKPDQPDQMRASHILIAPDDKTPEADKKAKAKAEDLLKQIKAKPELFEELAKENSTCPSGVSGGELPAFSKGQMVPEFEKATLALKEGELSPEVVKTQFGYHIIRRNALNTSVKVKSFEQAKPEIDRYLQMQKDMEEQRAQQKAVMDYFDKLEKDYKVKYLVDMPAAFSAQ